MAIDFRVRLRTEETLKPWTTELHPGLAPYIDLYRMTTRLEPLTVQENIDLMTSHGIEKAVICSGSSQENDVVADLCRAHPDRFIGFASISLDRGITQCYRDLSRAFEDLDLQGLGLVPCIQGVRADDRRHYPMYALTDDFGKIVVIHSSLHYNPHTPLEYGDPRYFDRIAVDFPDLKIVMSHAGVGFGNASLAIAQRHPNVFLEFSAIYPKYLPKIFIHAMNSFLKDKVLFGSDYPLIEYSVIEEWKKVVKPENHDAFFFHNAERLLGI
jgi:hypothetical protein